MGDFTYSKIDKLKSRKLIAEIFESGSSVSKYPLKAFYISAQLPQDVPLQVAVSVSKRNFKHAVMRNRIKRLLREAYRLEKQIIAGKLNSPIAVMIVYVSREEIPLALLRKKMRALLEKLNENFS